MATATSTTAKQGINRVHCKCTTKPCVEKAAAGRLVRVCGAGCTHPDRFAVRKRMPNGKQIYKQFLTFDAAKDELDKLTIEAVQQKADGFLADYRFEDIAEAWLKGQKRVAKKVRTIEEKEAKARVLVEVFGDRMVSKITVADVQALVDRWYDEEGKAGQTVHNYINVLMPILRRGGSKVTVGGDSGVMLPPRKSKGELATIEKRLYLQTAEELRQVVDAIETEPLALEPYRLLVLFSGFVGSRPGETWELRKRNVVNGQRLRITAAAESLSGARNDEGAGALYRIGKTKTHRSRVVWCPGPVLDAVKAAVCERDQVGDWSEVDEDALLFSEDGISHLDYNRFTKVWRKVVSEVLPPRLHRLQLYGLRHTCASLLANQGANILAVANQLGHSDVQTTQAHYAHLFPSVVDSLMGALSEDVAVVLAR